MAACVLQHKPKRLVEGGKNQKKQLKQHPQMWSCSTTAAVLLDTFVELELTDPLPFAPAQSAPVHAADMLKEHVRDQWTIG